MFQNVANKESSRQRGKRGDHRDRVQPALLLHDPRQHVHHPAAQLHLRPSAQQGETRVISGWAKFSAWRDLDSGSSERWNNLPIKSGTVAIVIEFGQHNSCTSLQCANPTHNYKVPRYEGPKKIEILWYLTGLRKGITVDKSWCLEKAAPECDCDVELDPR